MHEDTQAASRDQDLYGRRRDNDLFTWLGDSLKGVSEVRLVCAKALVEQGFEERGPEVLKALGLDAETLRAREEQADIQRRSRRKRGDIPEGKPLEARRAHVAVKALCGFFARCQAPTPRLADGSRVGAKGAALLARAGVLDQSSSEIEAHPRAKGRRIVQPAKKTAEKLGRELGALKRGDNRGPDETETPLPDDIGCGATRRNHRRERDARAQYDTEIKEYRRQQKLERKAAAAGNTLRNPAGVKPLPLHAGRKARKISKSNDEALRWLLSLPRELQAAVFVAATAGGTRGRFCEQARRVYAFMAFLLFVSEIARPSMSRSGFDRAVEGLPREALAASFVWNERTREPFHANTISQLVKTLQEVGLIVAESPNKDPNAYTGTTGWALNVYRVRNAEQLGALLRAYGVELVIFETEQAGSGHPVESEAPS